MTDLTSSTHLTEKTSEKTTIPEMGFGDRRFGVALLLIEGAMIALFAVLSIYEGPEHADLSKYAYFQDIHIMIFIGFGFLMTFLKRYGFGSVSFNMVIGAVAIQWAIICQRFLDMQGKFQITFTALIEGDIAAATVLISFGAVLGRLHPFQLLVMTMFEVVFFAINFWVGMHHFKALDAGGSIFIHTFGAYFGLAVAKVVHRDHHVDHQSAGSVYHSDLFSMIGTIFLWLAWPSFNAALVTDEDGQYRAIVNTYLSLVSCVCVTAALSNLIHRDSRLNMVHFQNATLAGGVAAGACGNFMIEPYGALVLGAIAALISVIGFDFISPFMAKTLKLYDTCGVHNLHGMPGLLSTGASILFIFLATPERYGNEGFAATFPNRVGENPWTASEQALHQLIALGITLGIALVGGLFTGLLLRIPFCGQLTDTQVYEDTPFWEMPPAEEYVTRQTATYMVQHNEKGEQIMVPMQAN